MIHANFCCLNAPDDGLESENLHHFDVNFDSIDSLLHYVNKCSLEFIYLENIVRPFVL